MELLCNNSKFEHPINNFKYIIYNGNIKVGDIFEEYDNLYYIKSEYLTNNSSEGENGDSEKSSESSNLSETIQNVPESIEMEPKQQSGQEHEVDKAEDQVDKLENS